MTIKDNGFEGGVADATVTVDGSDGDDFNSVIISGGQLTYSTLYPAHGARTALVNAGIGQQALLEYAVTASASIAFRGYAQFNTYPGATFDMVTLRASGNVTKIQVSTSGSVVVQNAAGTTVQTWTSLLSTYTMYRFEAVVTKGTTASNGRIQVRVFEGDSTTPLETFDSSSMNTGTANMGIVRFGNITSASGATFIIDDFAAADQASFIGPVVSAMGIQTYYYSGSAWT